MVLGCMYQTLAAHHRLLRGCKRRYRSTGAGRGPGTYSLLQALALKLLLLQVLPVELDLCLVGIRVFADQLVASLRKNQPLWGDDEDEKEAQRTAITQGPQMNTATCRKLGDRRRSPHKQCIERAEQGRVWDHPQANAHGKERRHRQRNSHMRELCAQHRRRCHGGVRDVLEVERVRVPLGNQVGRSEEGE